MAALILAAFTLAAGVFFHGYWALPADQQGMQSIMFWKNVAIAGGLLLPRLGLAVTADERLPAGTVASSVSSSAALANVCSIVLIFNINLFSIEAAVPYIE